LLDRPYLKTQIAGKYRVKPNVETLARAKAIVDKDFEGALNMVKNQPLSAESSAVGMELVRRLQKQEQWQQAADLIETMSRKATAAGQYNQAFAMWSKFTPEGMLRYAQNTIKQANEKMGFVTKTLRNILGKEPPKLESEDIKQINYFMRLAEKATTEQEQASYVKQAFEVINKKLPWGISDVIDEFRYNNMLSNPLTH